MKPWCCLGGAQEGRKCRLLGLSLRIGRMGEEQREGWTASENLGMVMECRRVGSGMQLSYPLASPWCCCEAVGFRSIV